ERGWFRAQDLGRDRGRERCWRRNPHRGAAATGRGGGMKPGSVQQTFTRALEALVDEIKQDRTVLAAILCGSLSHDIVWDKSDIDLVLVTVDDRKREERGIDLFANGVNTHAFLL